MSTALAQHTYLPSEAEREVAEVHSFLEAHARRGGEVAARYLLVGDGEGDQVELPRPVYLALLQVVDALAAGKAVNIAPQSMTLTTQQAADLLGVSRPTVVRLTDAGEVRCERIGNRRRILLGDLLAYREQRRAMQYQALAATGVDLDEEESADVVRDRLREARKAVAAQRRSS